MQIQISPAFAHQMIRTERRIFILSTCQQCNLGKLVSREDGSLQKWEQGHTCCRVPAHAPLAAA
jgi:hypothetical protein